VTRAEWDREFYACLDRLYVKGYGAGAAAKAREITIARFGQRPAGEPGPPWWMHLAGPAIGVPYAMLTKVWTFLNGKKTVIGAVITLVAYVVGGLPLLAAFLPAVTVAKVVGVGVFVVGALHKVYKFVYREEHN
jgi:hypothetical protein